MVVCKDRLTHDDDDGGGGGGGDGDDDDGGSVYSDGGGGDGDGRALPGVLQAWLIKERARVWARKRPALQSLAKWIRPNDPYPTEEAAKMALQGACGVAGSPERAQIALCFGNAVSDIDAPLGPEGWRAVHYAAYSRDSARVVTGRADSVLAFLVCECGANPDARDAHGWTPLHWSAHFGDAQTARLLLRDCGADPFLRATGAYHGHDAGASPLDVARRRLAAKEKEIGSKSFPLHKTAPFGSFGTLVRADSDGDPAGAPALAATLQQVLDLLLAQGCRDTPPAAPPGPPRAAAAAATASEPAAAAARGEEAAMPPSFWSDDDD